MSLLILFAGAGEGVAFTPQVYTVNLYVQPSPVKSLKANPSPAQNLKANPSPAKSLKSG